MNKTFICNHLAKTSYKLKKYEEALDYWKKILDEEEELLSNLNLSEDKKIDLRKEGNRTVVKNISTTYRKLIKKSINTETHAILENEYHQFLNKYTFPLKPINVDKKSFSIQQISGSILIKFIKTIETKKTTKFVKFIDGGILCTDGSIKPYNLVKMNDKFETEWKKPCLDGIRDICCFDETFLFHQTKWNNSSSTDNSTHQTMLYFMNKDGSAKSDIKIKSYVLCLDYNSNFVVIWSEDSKLRLFNSVGDLICKYNVNIRSIYDFRVSVSDTGLIFYNLIDKQNEGENKLYLVGKDKKISLMYKLSVNKKITEAELKNGLNINNNELESFSIDDDISTCISITVPDSNIIVASKISPNSKYLFFGMNIFKHNSNDLSFLYCLNLSKEIICKINLSFRIRGIYSSYSGDNLLVDCRNLNNHSYLYFIEKGIILNKIEVDLLKSHTLYLVKYHNQKEIFIVSNHNEILIFNKSGILLNKIIFVEKVKDFDMSENFDKLIVAVGKNIFLFSI